MKRVIKGKVYDTDKARLIYESRLEVADLIHQLYQKKTGEFFVFSVGFSPVLSEILRVQYDETAQIYPLTYEQAQEWGETEMPSERWEQFFGDPENDDSTVQTVITMPAVKLAMIKREAAKAGMTVSAYIVSRCVDKT